MSEWYEKIDPKIRDLISELRNNGINTTCSNGEKGYIEAEWHEDSDAAIVYELCREAGYKLVRIESIWTTFPVPQKYIKIRLYDKKFGNIPSTYVPKMYTKIIEPTSDSKVELQQEMEEMQFDLIPQEDNSHEKHEKIIRFLQPIFPTFVFVSQFDRRIMKAQLPQTKGKQMIYVLNYDMEKDKGFESSVKTYKQIDFYRLTVEATQKQAELFEKLGILVKGESDGDEGEVSGDTESAEQ